MKEYHYYQCRLVQASPLRISSGKGRETDNDLMYDSRRLPFLPGTALAGVLRSRLNVQDGNALFGYIDGAKLRESRVLVSDALLPGDTSPDDVHVSWRDGVGLNDEGGTLTGAKYNFEVVETPLPYTAVLEWCGDPAQDRTLTLLDQLLAQAAADGLSLGARTSRGYGQMQVSVQHKVFHFPADLAAWLDFDPLAPDAFAQSEPLQAAENTSSALHIAAELRMNGIFSVSVPTTDGSAPLHNYNDRPVIPGTAWAGSFRHHMRRLLQTMQGTGPEFAELDALFGKMPDGKDPRRSQVEFFETLIQGGSPITASHNALDRFTAGPADTALYTVTHHCGGTGVLEIRVPHGLSAPLCRQLLAAALIDLNDGLMTVGGSARMGAGTACITRLTVNGQDRTQLLYARSTDFLD